MLNVLLVFVPFMMVASSLYVSLIVCFGIDNLFSTEEDLAQDESCMILVRSYWVRVGVFVVMLGVACVVAYGLVMKYYLLSPLYHLSFQLTQFTNIGWGCSIQRLPDCVAHRQTCMIRDIAKFIQDYTYVNLQYFQLLPNQQCQI